MQIDPREIIPLLDGFLQQRTQERGVGIPADSEENTDFQPRGNGREDGRENLFCLES